jgi:hypothetical protein
MDWQAAVRARLLEAEPVTGFVGESGVYWADRPQASELPAITLETISDLRPQHLKGFDGLNPARVQIDCWAESHKAANELAEAAIAALVPAQSGNGITFSRGAIEGKRDLGERVGDRFIHRVSIDLLVHHSTA